MTEQGFRKGDMVTEEQNGEHGEMHKKEQPRGRFLSHKGYKELSQHGKAFEENAKKKKVGGLGSGGVQKKRFSKLKKSLGQLEGGKRSTDQKS